MSGNFFKRRRTSSVVSDNQSLPFHDATNSADVRDTTGQDSGRPIGRPLKFGRTVSTGSTAGLSSSYSLPSRSYIHHASHGAQGTMS